MLRSTDPLRPELSYIINTQTNEQLHEWMKAITDILQTQHDFLKAITSPIAYQKELTKESWVRNYCKNQARSPNENESLEISKIQIHKNALVLYIKVNASAPCYANQYQWAMKLKCILRFSTTEQHCTTVYCYYYYECICVELQCESWWSCFWPLHMVDSTEKNPVAARQTMYAFKYNFIHCRFTMQ